MRERPDHTRDRPRPIDLPQLGKGSDVKEGVVSFLEKRPPNFQD